MAKKSNLLKEAIADAKTVRETAIENARLALEEAFTPAVKSLLSKKIQMEMEDDVPEDELEDEVEEEAPAEEEPEIAVEPEEGEEELEDEDEDEVEVETVEEEAPDEETADEEEADEEAVDEEAVDEEGDLDLEAILRELEDDDEEAEVEEPEFEDEEEPAEESVALDEDDDEVDIDIEDDDEEEEEAEVEDEDIDLEEVLRALSEDEDNDVSADDSVELSTLRKENEEYRQTVEYLRSKLNEINLLNAKLLFTNKLFKKQSLTNNQKLTVVEQFDRAHNLREIKLVYATLLETFAGKSVRVKPIKGSASKPIGSTKPKKEDVLQEGADLKARFKQLANIKK